MFAGSFLLSLCFVGLGGVALGIILAWVVPPRRDGGPFDG
jgi:hypothetical protein